MQGLIPNRVIEKIKDLEEVATITEAREIAKSLCHIKAGPVILEAAAFYPNPNKTILSDIYRLKLDHDLNIIPGRSVRATGEYWMHALVPLGTYVDHNEDEVRAYRFYKKIISLIPGINLKKAQELIKSKECSHLGSILISLGGNTIEDHLSGRSDEQELIMDALGLGIVEEYTNNRNMKLSELLENANSPANTEKAMNFKDSGYYDIVKQCLTPAKYLAGFFTFFPRPLNLIGIRLDKVY